MRRVHKHRLLPLHFPAGQLDGGDEGRPAHTGPTAISSSSSLWRISRQSAPKFRITCCPSGAFVAVLASHDVTVVRLAGSTPSVTHRIAVSIIFALTTIWGCTKKQ